MKKFISAIIIVALIFGTSVCGFCASGKRYCSTPCDLFEIIKEDGHMTAPIKIVKAGLSRNGSYKNIYLIWLVGVETNNKQENKFINTIPSALNIDNNYTKLIKSVLLENIPMGSNIVFCGHSLGGMVAQQLSADKVIKDNFNLISTLTLGSPYIVVTEKREGELHRLCDVNDAVPFLSAATFIAPKTQLSSRDVEDAGFFLDPDSAHNVSYLDKSVWGEYDALGVKDGNAVITYNHGNIKEFGKVS